MVVYLMVIMIFMSLAIMALIFNQNRVSARMELLNDLVNVKLIDFSNLQSEFNLVHSKHNVMSINLMKLLKDNLIFNEKLEHYFENLKGTITENENELDTSLSYIENRLKQAEELFLFIAADHISISEFKEKVRMVYAHIGNDQAASVLESEVEQKEAGGDAAQAVTGDLLQAAEQTCSKNLDGYCEKHHTYYCKDTDAENKPDAYVLS